MALIDAQASAELHPLDDTAHELTDGPQLLGLAQGSRQQHDAPAQARDLQLVRQQSRLELLRADPEMFGRLCLGQFLVLGDELPRILHVSRSSLYSLGQWVTWRRPLSRWAGD